MGAILAVAPSKEIEIMSKVKCFCGSIKKQKKAALNFLEMIQADRGFAAVDIKPLFWSPLSLADKPDFDTTQRLVQINLFLL